MAPHADSIHPGGAEGQGRWSGSGRLKVGWVPQERNRLRAVRNCWIPRLERALAVVSQALEEQELADNARLRLAVRPAA